MFKASRSGQIDLPCPACQELFSTRIALGTHLRNVHGEKEPFYCLLCPARLGTLAALRAHQMSLHPQAYANAAAVTCKPCSRLFATPFALNYHQQRSEVCSKVVAAEAQRAKNQGQFQCVLCLTLFQKEKEYNQHAKFIHSLDRPHLCSLVECRRQFESHRLLLAHSELAHSEKGASKPLAQKKSSLTIELVKKEGAVAKNESMAAKQTVQRELKRPNVDIKPQTQQIKKEIAPKEEQTQKPISPIVTPKALQIKKEIAPKAAQVKSEPQSPKSKYECEECHVQFSHEIYLRCHKVTHQLSVPKRKASATTGRAAKKARKAYTMQPPTSRLKSATTHSYVSRVNANLTNTPVNKAPENKWSHACKVCGEAFMHELTLQNHAQLHRQTQPQPRQRRDLNDNEMKSLAARTEGVSQLSPSVTVSVVKGGQQ